MLVRNNHDRSSLGLNKLQLWGSPPQRVWRKTSRSRVRCAAASSVGAQSNIANEHRFVSDVHAARQRAVELGYSTDQRPASHGQYYR